MQDGPADKITNRSGFDFRSFSHRINGHEALLKESVMVTSEQVYEALRECYDPEIPINIVDLGLVYDVAIDDDHVNVVMTLTARGCPAHTFISESVRLRVAKIPGVKSANVQVVWDPPWDISRVSEAGKKRLGLM
jgi:metal-sulfur cluster biosynthetic enzyme